MSTVEQQLLVGAIGGLIAALVTSALSLAGVLVGLRHATGSDRRADERHLRDDRRERLRTAIETVLHAALAVGQVVHEQQFLFRTETEDQRNERHGKLLEKGWAGLNQARVALMVQRDGRELVRIVDIDILGSYQKFMIALAVNRAHPGTVHVDQINDHQAKVMSGIEALRAEGQRVLDEMDRPI